MRHFSRLFFNHGKNWFCDLFISNLFLNLSQIPDILKSCPLLKTDHIYSTIGPIVLILWGKSFWISLKWNVSHSRILEFLLLTLSYIINTLYGLFPFYIFDFNMQFNYIWYQSHYFNALFFCVFCHFRFKIFAMESSDSSETLPNMASPDLFAGSILSLTGKYILAQTIYLSMTINRWY